MHRRDLFRMFGAAFIAWFGARQEGFVTGATAVSLTDVSQSWDVDHWSGGTLMIVSGCGRGQSRRIVANTEHTLTIDERWRIVPGPSMSEYIVLPDTDAWSVAS